MKRFSEQLNKKSESIHLKLDEKRLLKERLVSYMEYHPLPVKQKSQVFIQESPIDPVVRIIHINNWKFLQWSGMAIATLLLVVPYVAEKSVPGDALYAVKVNFNEEVRSTLTLSPYEKVAWETERLNRRIAEARLLTSEGKMTEEIENSVAEAVRVHSQNAKKEIETLKQTDESGAVLASIQLDTAIDVQTTALQSDLQASSTESVMATKIVGVLNETQNNVDQDLAQVIPSRDRLVGQVEMETTRAYELLGNIKNYATTEEQSDIKRRLEDIDRKTAVAMGIFETSETEAGKQMLDILEDTQKLIVFMTNIDVRSSLTVDQIVPVTLTEAERLESVNKQITEIFRIIEDSELALTATSTEKVGEKARFTIDNSKTELQENILPAINRGDFDLTSVENKVQEILNQVKDIKTSLGVRDSDIDLIRKDNETSTSTNSVDSNISTSTATTTESL
jgi:hypothetical protein